MEWLKKHSKEYAGNYVSLKDGELIAFGRTIKEADMKEKKKVLIKRFCTIFPQKMKKFGAVGKNDYDGKFYLSKYQD